MDGGNDPCAETNFLSTEIINLLFQILLSMQVWAGPNGATGELEKEPFWRKFVFSAESASSYSHIKKKIITEGGAGMKGTGVSIEHCLLNIKHFGNPRQFIPCCLL